MSYGINERFYLIGTAYLRDTPVTLADVKFPSSTYFVGDVFSNNAPTFSNDGSFTAPQNGAVFNRLRFPKSCPGVSTGGAPALTVGYADPDRCTRHSGGGTIVFADSHAKWLNWRAMNPANATPTRTTE